ncbi:MAG: aminoacyl-tRNA hydrolase [Ignavibacteria bacterium]|nr:aminoacyl-tRNA hydrolase [Ignavibacteria bacterium]MBI3765992.1 aminoacyl-tRNA hydrolase [Ignavibacteriales bacterium]
MGDVITINESLAIPRSELTFKFARSGGPGGQNVNKVETRVELLFDVQNSPSLNDEQRENIKGHLKSRIDTEGMLHVVAQTSRSQWKNREEAVERLTDLLRRALKPRKKRIKTKTTRAAKENRLEGKKHRSQIKQMRRFERE